MNATEWLVAFVRDVMSKDFQATDLAKILQRFNPQVPAGVDALKWIERVFMAARQYGMMFAYKQPCTLMIVIMKNCASKNCVSKISS